MVVVITNPRNRVGARGTMHGCSRTLRCASCAGARCKLKNQRLEIVQSGPYLFSYANAAGTIIGRVGTSDSIDIIDKSHRIERMICE